MFVTVVLYTPDDSTCHHPHPIAVFNDDDKAWRWIAEQRQEFNPTGSYSTKRLPLGRPPHEYEMLYGITDPKDY